MQGPAPLIMNSSTCFVIQQKYASNVQNAKRNYCISGRLHRYALKNILCVKRLILPLAQELQEAQEQQEAPSPALGQSPERDKENLMGHP